ncbi:MAG: hypothetical protein NTW86_22675 [Candidatus Sumerlaeota bacterium]|nr:hypothetical protein [Candidatus Sumerlaeota bacterium]
MQRRRRGKVNTDVAWTRQRCRVASAATHHPAFLTKRTGEGGGPQGLGDPAKAEAGIQSIETTLLAAKACRASAILVVPTALKGRAAPKPWEFDVEVDEATTHLKRVAAGDNAPCEDIGYDGGMTTEGSAPLSLAEQGKGLDLIVAGKQGPPRPARGRATDPKTPGENGA